LVYNSAGVSKYYLVMDFSVDGVWWSMQLRKRVKITVVEMKTWKVVKLSCKNYPF